MIVDTSKYTCHCNESTNRQEAEQVKVLTIYIPTDNNIEDLEAMEVFCNGCGGRIY